MTETSDFSSPADNTLDAVDVTVIGAGVIGLAIARCLSADHKVVILEKQAQFGSGISSRNSEVIHAGIYYPKNSLKASLCVEGKKLLYTYCASHNIPHQRCGKLIVATNNEEIPQLKSIAEHASANGVDDLQLLDRFALNREEPELNAVAALFSPSTGIVDSHQLMLSLLGDAQKNAALISYQCELKTIEPLPNQGHTKSGFILSTVNGPNADAYQFFSRIVINAAGLQAQTLASQIKGLAPDKIPKLYLCRGSYYSLAASNPFQHLIYPVPTANITGLGIHATMDMAGQCRFGPDVEYLPDNIEQESYYQFEEPETPASQQQLARYYQAIRRYYPALKDDSLSASYVGIRPKLQGPEDSFADFCIQTEAEHGLPGLVQLFGIESPGLTASLAIAERVKSLISSA